MLAYGFLSQNRKFIYAIHKRWTVVLQFLSDEFFSPIYLTVNPLADLDFHQFFDLFEYIIKQYKIFQ